MIVDGKALSRAIYRDLKARRAHHARPPRLGLLVANADPVIESFVRIKMREAESLGIAIERADLPQDTTTKQVIAAVGALAEKNDAVIVQLPLPKQVDVNASLSVIPKEKDVDAINPGISDDARLVHAPVALAVVEILTQAKVPIKGARAVVVGGGRLVGTPTASLLKRLGAEVSMFTLEEGSIDDLKDADIIVCGAGNPGFIRPEHIKNGVALIDAGASEQGGVIRGDADPACAEKASVFTPVPGGVGPVAVAMIFKNLFDLIEKAPQ